MDLAKIWISKMVYYQPKILKIFVNLYQLRYCAAMIQICIFPNCNRDAGGYDVTEPENSTVRVAPR